MVTHDVLKVLKIALAYGSCNFENFQNITRAHKSRNALAFIRFPIHIIPVNKWAEKVNFFAASLQFTSMKYSHNILVNKSGEKVNFFAASLQFTSMKYS